MALIKNRCQPCVCGCGLTRGGFIEALIRGPARVDIDTAARIWVDQRKCLIKATETTVKNGYANGS